MNTNLEFETKSALAEPRINLPPLPSQLQLSGEQVLHLALHLAWTAH